MEKKIVYDVSQSEGLIMDYLWESEEGRCFREITKYLNEDVGKEWKKQTMNTFLNRLSNKGLITAEMKKGGRIYHAAMTKVEYEKGRAHQFLEKYYDDSLVEFISVLSGGKNIDEKLANKLLEWQKK